jgi:hypothetical protein
MAVRYCQIAIFQGFGVTIPRLESEPENSRLGSCKMTVSGMPLDGANLRPETIFYLRLCADVRVLSPGRQKVTLARLIIGNRSLEAAQRGRPKFHAIQVLVQALKRFGEIAYDLVFRRFRHDLGPRPAIDVLFLERLRGCLAVWFQCCHQRMTD